MKRLSLLVPMVALVLVLFAVGCGSPEEIDRETGATAVPTKDIFAASTGRKPAEDRGRTGSSAKVRPTPSPRSARPTISTVTLNTAKEMASSVPSAQSSAKSLVVEPAALPPVFVGKWGPYGSADGKLKKPAGVAVAPDGTVYVADTKNNRIQKFTSEGVFLTNWGKTGSTKGTGDGEFWEPRGIAVGPDGSVYVADTKNNRIQKFTSEGVFLTKWGEGPNPGKGYWECCYKPSGIAVASAGSVYVVNTAGGQIMKFTSDGVEVGQWGTTGNGNGEFKSAYGVAVASDGSVYVGDAGNDRIQKFTSEGMYVGQWGTVGNGDGEFFDPSGVAVGPDGSVYVADFVNHRIQKFTSEGVFLTKWGKWGHFDGGQFNAPRGIAVASDGSVYVADRDNNRIQYFSQLVQ